mmetsp:Transcript_124391/g.194883  ORF Transcript_124391/g.194883 Transcript_124391/m.194883 type:complete len:131 (+) Transcript_124391:55-447(+)
MVDRNAVTVVNGDVFADQRPATAGLPLAVIGKDGLLASPLHPPTHPLFQYSRKRQAYGSVSPRVVPAIRHQPLRDASQYEDECRKDAAVHSEPAVAVAQQRSRLEIFRTIGRGSPGEAGRMHRATITSYG